MPSKKKWARGPMIAILGLMGGCAGTGSDQFDAGGKIINSGRSTPGGAAPSGGTGGFALKCSNFKEAGCNIWKACTWGAVGNPCKENRKCVESLCTNAQDNTSEPCSLPDANPGCNTIAG